MEIIHRKVYCKYRINLLSLKEILLPYRTLKCELASLINKENTYQMIIKEKSDSIRKLEKQLADVIQSQTASNK
jgi:Neuraminidase (sialidase)